MDSPPLPEADPEADPEEEQVVVDHAAFLLPLFDKVEELVPFLKPYRVESAENVRVVLDVLVKLERGKGKCCNFY